jgi:hypothetical protein
LLRIDVSFGRAPNNIVDVSAVLSDHLGRAANARTRSLLWVRSDSGHTPQVYDEPTVAARTFAFLLWQTGDPRHQPR